MTFVISFNVTPFAIHFLIKFAPFALFAGEKRVFHVTQHTNVRMCSLRNVSRQQKILPRRTKGATSRTDVSKYVNFTKAFFLTSERIL